MKISVGSFVLPGTSRENKTGSWRVNWPSFDLDICIACALCEWSCPEGCISGDKVSKYNADLDYCKGCGICAEICPVAAIDMKPEVR